MSLETIKIDKELKSKLDKVSAKAPYLRGKGKMIELDPDNEQHKEWFEDDHN